MPNGNDILAENIFAPLTGADVASTQSILDRAVSLINTDILKQAAAPIDAGEELLLTQPSTLPTTETLTGLLQTAMQSEAPNLFIGSLARRIPQAALQESRASQAAARAALRAEGRQQAALQADIATTAGRLAGVSGDILTARQALRTREQTRAIEEAAFPLKQETRRAELVKTAAETRRTEAQKVEAERRAERLRQLTPGEVQEQAAVASIKAQEAAVFQEKFNLSQTQRQQLINSSIAANRLATEKLKNATNKLAEADRQAREKNAIRQSLSALLVKDMNESRGLNLTDEEQRQRQFRVVTGAAAEYDAAGRSGAYDAASDILKTLIPKDSLIGDGVSGASGATGRFNLGTPEPLTPDLVGGRETTGAF